MSVKSPVAITIFLCRLINEIEEGINLFWRRTVPTLACLLVALGCAPLIADYNPDALKTATALKAETAFIIDKSGDRFVARQAQVDELTTKIDAAYELAAATPNNSVAAAQWRTLRDPEGALYGGFIRVWKARSTTSSAYRTEKKAQISSAFDYIICLEVNKRELKRCADAITGSE